MARNITFRAKDIPPDIAIATGQMGRPPS